MILFGHVIAKGERIVSIKTNILDQIDGPTEVKKLTIDEMSELATEMREKILQKIVRLEDMSVQIWVSWN